MDMEQYLVERRQQEWFPVNIPGLYRLSKTEVNDDLDYINQNLPNNINNSIHDRNKFKRRANLLNSDSESKDRADEINGINNKRIRLLSKIQAEHQREASLRGLHGKMKGELHELRMHLTQYEDAIAQVRRELDVAKRERESAEERMDALREDFKQSMESSERNREAYLREENELRVRLSKESELNAESTDRLAQMRGIEEELRLKDARILELDAELQKVQRQLMLLENLVVKRPLDSVPTALSPSHLNNNTAAAVPAPANTNSSAAVPMDTSSTESNTSTSATPSSDSTIPHPHSHAPSPPTVTASPATSTANATTAIATSPTGAAPNGLSFPDTNSLVDFIKRNTEQTTQLEKQIKLSDDKNEVLLNKVAELERICEDRDGIIEEQNKRISELTAHSKIQEQLFKQEAKKVEELIKEVDILSRHKDDQEQCFGSQAEKMRVYEQILAVADRRATVAEDHLRDMIAEIKIVKNGNLILQNSYNVLLEELAYKDEVPSINTTLSVPSTPHTNFHTLSHSYPPLGDSSNSGAEASHLSDLHIDPHSSTTAHTPLSHNNPGANNPATTTPQKPKYSLLLADNKNLLTRLQSSESNYLKTQSRVQQLERMLQEAVQTQGHVWVNAHSVGNMTTATVPGTITTENLPHINNTASNNSAVSSNNIIKQENSDQMNDV